ncbi:RodZ domain-containing protein [Geobacter pickeringii]|uniref:HTH cro/C1-type domain-containing protein n=1 Tax=Geobacter pickeringii TaxID=345632 RepID=A0A0B5BFA3_9BACT|nr:RodZ domain-containing protein [Geobacter pickeringii]AJE03824.1 hypothetical protein GPICK_11095 [Geobacter pickeringii]
MAEASSSRSGNQSVGALLRESRESRGLSLEDAARVTRIGKNYLVALEEDAFERLPSSAYAKGFLRSYAGYLGLPADEVVRYYEEALQPALPAEEGSVAPLASSVEARRLPARNRWAIPLTLLALVIALSFLTREREERSSRGEPVSSASRATVSPSPVQHPVSSASRVRPVAAPPQVSPVAAISGEENQPSPQNSRGIVLKLKVNQDCWLNITIDGTLSQQYELKAGDLIEWKGERVFSLDLGNAGGVEAEFNGKALPSLGAAGSPAHVDLTADGSEEQQ